MKNNEREVVFVIGMVPGEFTYEDLEKKIAETLYPDDTLVSSELECKVKTTTYRFCYYTDHVRKKI